MATNIQKRALEILEEQKRTGKSAMEIARQGPKADLTAKVQAKVQALGPLTLTRDGTKLTPPGQTAPVEVKTPAYDIKALGAGDYGAQAAGKLLERSYHTASAGVKGTAGNIVNLLGDFTPNGLTIGEEARIGRENGYTEAARRKAADAKQKAQKDVMHGVADRLSESAAADTEKAKEGLGTVGQLLVDAGVSGTQMLGDAALNLLVPGAGLAGLGVRAYGSATQKARREGATENQQFAYGALTAATEILTEKMFGVFEGVYGKGLLDKSKLVKTVKKAVGKLNGTAFGTILGSMGEEALEEVVAGAVEPAFEYIYGGKGYNEDTLSEIVSAALVGGIMGGIGGAGQVIGSRSGATLTRDGVKLNTPAGQQITPAATVTPAGQQLTQTGPITPAAQAQKNTATAAENIQYNTIDYRDNETKTAIMQNKHNEMMSKGKIVSITDDNLSAIQAYYPDLRTEKKATRVEKLKKSRDALKVFLENSLKKISGVPIDFTINGNTIEATLHSTGIKEVLEKLTQEKSSMLTQSKEIFQNAEYLYSTEDKANNPDVARWNYFYCPVQIGDSTVGVRIAIRDMVRGSEYGNGESQIYHWGIKKDATLGGEGRDLSVASLGASSVTSNDRVPQPTYNVKQNSSTEADSLKMSLAEGMGMSTPRTRAQEAAAIEATKAAQGETTRAAMEEAGEKLPKPQTPNATAMTVNGVTYDVTTPEGYAAYQEAAKAAQNNQDAKAWAGTNAAPAGSSLAKLGINVAGDQGNYTMAKEIRENEKAKFAAKKDVERLEAKLMPNNEEKHLAHSVANGSMRAQYIYTDGSVNRATVLQLAEAYRWQSATENKTMAQQRAIIADINERAAAAFYDRAADSGRPNAFRNKMFLMNERTPERVAVSMFGEELGEEFNEYYFYPTQHNEDESRRFQQRQLDDVRTFVGKDGKASELTKDERTVVQQMLEDRYIPEEVAKMETSGDITKAAQNMLNGQAAEDAAKEFSLPQEEQKMAERLARWKTNQDKMNAGELDGVKIEAAVKEYSEKYDQFYDAINDFLVAHGYQPIGFIKGYAPHMQGADKMNMLKQAMQALGIKADAIELPTSITGKTADYKPRKRFWPNALKRHSDKTDYDVARGYQSYVSYMADILYHTDDIARIRGAEKALRKKYAPEELSSLIDWAQTLRNADQATIEDALRQAGKIEGDTTLSRADAVNKLEEYISELYDDVSKVTRYGEFAKYLDNYANILAGKQSMADRGMEFMAGRQSLNWGNKLVAAFGRAQVAGNVSSVLNQTAQLAQIQAEVPQKHILSAIRDLGKETGFKGFWDMKHTSKIFDTSDFLNSKKGIDYLTAKDDWQDRFVDFLFKGADWMDGLVSAIAYKSKYNQLVAEGTAPEAAELGADRFAKQVMGSRAKGSRPMAFESKNLAWQMLNMFQLEAINSADHLMSDIGGNAKKVKAQYGKTAASRYIAGVAVKGLFSAFLLNRIIESVSGGTPAPFDILGYILRFFSSALGVSSNELLKHGFVKFLNNTLGGLTGEEIDESKLKELQEFNAGRGAEEALSDIGNDVPLVRNGLALAGLGDQTIPLAGIASKGSNLVKSIHKNGLISPETGEAALGAASTVIPGGRQLQKTEQGILTLARGGRYYGFGDNKRLQYPVEPNAGNIAQGVFFGPNGLSESRDFYAAGGKGLSASQTQKGIELIRNNGMNWDQVLKSLYTYRKINDMDISASEKATMFSVWLDGTELNAQQKSAVSDKFKFFSMVPADATRYEDLKGMGLSPQTAEKITGAIADLEPEYGKETVSDAQKCRAIVNTAGLTDAEMRSALETIYEEGTLEKFHTATAAGIKPKQFVGFQEEVSNCTGRKGAGGKTISGSKKEQVLDVIDSMDLTPYQKDVLYRSMEYSEKEINNTPWNGRSDTPRLTSGGIRWY